MTLEWKAPPAEDRTPRGKHDVVIEQLKARPGQWARVMKDMASSGAQEPWKRRGCEVATRRAESGKYKRRDIYARWPESGAAPVIDAEKTVVPPPPPFPAAGQKPAAEGKKTWKVNGKEMPPPPKPLTFHMDETSEERQARRLKDRENRQAWMKGEVIPHTEN